ncbi:MAG TPA: hypothetical protein VGO31_07640 [Microbacteriaceae bacterium]|jgi:hypothetical protein|nr:hypothetical protein [Microbacteriaceae bacterium]
MSLTEEIHSAILQALDGHVVAHSYLGAKPLEVDLALPLPPRLRVYAYSLVGGAGTVRPTEFKVVLRVPGQPVGEYGSFDHSGGRVAIVLGYRRDLEVFVLWDASLHGRFKNGGNVQVKNETVYTAVAMGSSTQVRSLADGVKELVIAVRSTRLPQALGLRVSRMGPVTESDWAISEI